MSKFNNHFDINDVLGLAKTCVTFRIYAEQLGLPSDATASEQVAALNNFLAKLVIIETPEDGYEPKFIIDGIVHDCDAVGDASSSSVGALKYEKAHAHLMITCIGRGKRVNTILQWLAARGCVWRKGIDDMALNTGVKFPELKRHMDVATFVYLTHETFAAIDEGKYQYPRSFIHSTRSKADRARMYEDYAKYFTKVTLDPNVGPREADKIALGFRARLAGETNTGFEAWWSTVEDKYRVRPSYKSFALDYYNEGVDKYLSSAPYISRVCVYIYGPADCGKTYGAQHALMDLGYKVRKISRSAGTGIYDRLRPGDCAVFDDFRPDHLAGFVEDAPVELYKRGSGNPLFSGRFCVITGNESPQEFFRHFSGEDYAAVRSRVLCITVNSDGSLMYDLPAKVRGDLPRIKDKLDAFAEFAKAFESYTVSYAKARPISMGFDFKAYLDEKGLNASGKVVKPGDVIGTEIYHNGTTGEAVEVPVFAQEA